MKKGKRADFISHILNLNSEFFLLERRKGLGLGINSERFWIRQLEIVSKQPFLGFYFVRKEEPDLS